MSILFICRGRAGACFGGYSSGSVQKRCQNGLYVWLECHRTEDFVTAVNGKTICGTKTGNHEVYHVVSKVGEENLPVLGDFGSRGKSIEIERFPNFRIR